MIVKTNGHVIYSATKPPMKMCFWNLQSFEHLEKSLKSWLDWEVNDGEKIRSIERLVSYISIADDNNDMQRMWVRVRDDNDVRDMVFASDDIVLIVVIS